MKKVIKKYNLSGLSNSLELGDFFRLEHGSVVYMVRLTLSQRANLPPEEFYCIPAYGIKGRSRTVKAGVKIVRVEL